MFFSAYWWNELYAAMDINQIVSCATCIMMHIVRKYGNSYLDGLEQCFPTCYSQATICSPLLKFCLPNNLVPSKKVLARFRFKTLANKDWNFRQMLFVLAPNLSRTTLIFTHFVTQGGWHRLLTLSNSTLQKTLQLFSDASLPSNKFPSFFYLPPLKVWETLV